MSDRDLSNAGIFTISLDFELYWGMRESVSLEDEAFCQRLESVYEAVPAILKLFQEYNIHSTWAVVGFLHYKNSQELQAHFPTALPQYENRDLSPYSDLEKLDSTTKQYKFCPELIELIKQSG